MRCDRCRRDVTTTTMSRFNTQTICMDCNDDERKAPGYKHAAEVELEAVKQGNYNYPGVGLSAEDQAFLKARLREREGNSAGASNPAS